MKNPFWFQLFQRPVKLRRKEVGRNKEEGKGYYLQLHTGSKGDTQWAALHRTPAFTTKETKGQESHCGPSTDSTAEVFSLYMFLLRDKNLLYLPIAGVHHTVSHHFTH